MEKKQNNYIKIFLLSFCMFMVIIIPIIIYNKGYLIYYGDFNSQQLPFLRHMHEAVRSGNFLWDWNTDLGSDFMSSYSYYLLGSPFFWLMLLLPSGLVLYSVPWILALKYAVAALTSYAYIKRFTKLESSAFIGAILYAFSGFQAYNIFFNQFHDATAFFPLMLIALEEHITRDRRGMFAAVTALMALTNYFFFAGQAVFLVIYFLIRSGCRDFRVTPSKFFTLILEAVLGTAVSAFILLPTALTVSGNFRISEYLCGMDLLAYSDRTRIWRILQGFFMIPDSPARPNLFSDGTAKWSSIAGYLPLFSMACVISSVKYRPDSWTSRLIKLCVIFAFVPVLNSSFFMFNSEYYARWYYMPVLIMALVTVQVFERPDIKTASGFRTCFIFFAAMLIISFLPAKQNNETVWSAFGKYKEYFYISLGLSAVSLTAAAYLFSCKKRRKEYMKKGTVFTVTAAFAATASVFWFGIYEGPYPDRFIAASVNDSSSDIISDDTDFFRTDISEGCDNYAMFWGYPSMRSFHSTVSPSVMEFYDSIGIRRDVASRAETSVYALRGLFSVKYYFSKYDDETGKEEHTPDMPGFIKISDGDRFAVYENKEFVPVGFTYDTYISQEDYDALPDEKKPNALMHSVLLNSEQIQKYSSILEKSDLKPALLTRQTYTDDCFARRRGSCSDFSKSTGGFNAKITADRDSLVFFSIPYDRGFTAYVNGKKTEIEKVNSGFMAVKVPEGSSTITFSYITFGLETGIKISAAAFLMLLVYIVISMAHRLHTDKNSAELRRLSGEIEPDEETAKIKINEESTIDIRI